MTLSGAFFTPRRVARAVLAIALTVGAVYLVSRRAGMPPQEILGLILSLLTLGLLLLPLPVLLSGRGVKRLRTWVGGRPLRAAALPAVLLAPCLLYWSIPGVVTLDGVLRLVLYIGIPVELRLLSASFPWPHGSTGSFLMSPLGLDLVLYLMLVARGFDATGLTLRMGAGDVASATGSFAAFAAVGVPIGLRTGFLIFGLHDGAPLFGLAGGLVILIFTGLPEEVLFRGLI